MNATTTASVSSTTSNAKSTTNSTITAAAKGTDAATTSAVLKGGATIPNCEIPFRTQKRKQHNVFTA